MPAKALRGIVALWMVWSVIVIGFQTFVDLRYQPNRPDRALAWTPNETGRSGQDGKPYLLDPFLNHQVSFDSEFYLSIALAGYDDPSLRTASTPEGPLSLNYAFFPLYPLFMRVVGQPLIWAGLTPLQAMTAAGVAISLAGALIGLLALYHLDPMSEKRSLFYLLIFPSAFFMATVFTEGLFIGLAFAALALASRDRLWLAAGCAVLAVWTRSVGVLLIIPLLIGWLRVARTAGWRITPVLIVRALPVLLPILAYGLWMLTLGQPFGLVQENFFGRSTFNLWSLGGGILDALAVIGAGDNPQAVTYFLLEAAGVLLALVCSLWMIRHDPAVGLFSLAALVLAVTSGAPQSLIRYVLPLPAVFLALSRLAARSPTFDRAWTMASLLLLAMQSSLFTFDMWVA